MQMEPASFDDATNSFLEQGKLPVHLTTILDLFYPFILILILECALGYRSWIGVVVVLSLPSDPPYG
jgi:hypothetical protein